MPSREALKELILRALAELGGYGERDVIVAKAVELGAFTLDQLAAPVPLSAAEEHASLIHYRLSWALAEAGRDGDLKSYGHGMWCLARREGRAQARHGAAERPPQGAAAPSAAGQPRFRYR
jgi:hypothetical protein